MATTLLPPSHPKRCHNWQATAENYAQALDLYQQAQANSSGLTRLSIQLNQVRALLKRGKSVVARQRLLDTEMADDAALIRPTMPALYYLAAVDLGLHLGIDSHLLNAWLQAAQGTDDSLLQSYALGWQAQIYAQQNRWEEALEFSQQARFAAQRRFY